MLHRQIRIAPFFLGLAVLLGGLPLVVRAELPEMRLDRLQPLGIAAGSSVEVEIVGRDLEDVQKLWTGHRGITAEFVKERKFKLTVVADVPEGTYDLRAVGRFGVSNSRLFAVSRKLQDVVEKEPNNEAAEAQVIAVNSAVNGSSDGNGQDCFRFPLKKGERVSIDCQAMRLDSPMDASLIVTSLSGSILATNGDYFGRDPFVDFLAPADGEYVVIVHDLSYRGGFPYRLLLTNRPHVENLFPRAIQAGQTVELSALGRNLGPQAKPSKWVLNDLVLEEFKFPFTAKTHLTTAGLFEFSDHPTDHSVLPTAATCTLTGTQVRPVVDGIEALHPSCVVVSEHPVTLEAEPNDERDKAQVLQIPAVVSGRFDVARDADWYQIETVEAGPYYIDVYSERIAGRADPYVVVYDDKNNVVAELDDFGHRMNAFDGHLRDPSGNVSLQAKKVYQVLVQDRYSRGGARFQYVLSIRKPVPDFHVAAIHSDNPGPAGTNLWKGGAVSLDLVVHQRDGFNGPITITAEELPTGVHMRPAVANNSTRSNVVLWSDANAPDVTVPVKLWATGQQGEKTLRREVRPYTRVFAENNVSSSRPARDLVLSVLSEKAPYALKIVPERLQVEAGKKAELKLQVTRYWPEFKDKVNAITLGFPAGFNMGAQSIPANQTEISFTIDVQANLRPGEYTLAVLGQAQVPYTKTPGKGPAANTLVSIPSQPVTLDVIPAEKK